MAKRDVSSGRNGDGFIVDEKSSEEIEGLRVSTDCPVQVYISLGSNFQRENHLEQAIKKLHGYFPSINYSPVFRSPSINTSNRYSPRDEYFNQAACFTTSESEQHVRSILKKIENELGRDRNTPDVVSIDIDLLLYGDVNREDEQPLPHPDIFKYAHTAIPLLSLTPDLKIGKAKVLLKTIVEKYFKGSSIELVEQTDA